MSDEVPLEPIEDDVHVELTQAEAHVERLLTEVEDLKKKNSELKGERDSYIEQLSSETSESFEKKLEAKDARIAYLEKLTSDAERELVSKKSRITELEETCNRLAKTLTERDSLSAAPPEIAKSYSDLEESFKKQATLITDLMNEKKTLHESLIAKDLQLTKAIKELSAIEVEKDAKTTRIAELEMKLKVKETQRAELEHECLLQKGKLRSVKDHVEYTIENLPNLVYDSVKPLTSEEFKKESVKMIMTLGLIYLPPRWKIALNPFCKFNPSLDDVFNEILNKFKDYE